MDFKAKYNKEEYIRFFSTLFGNGNFQKIDRSTPVGSGSFGESMYFKSIHTLGLVKDLDGLDDGLIVLEIQHQSSRDARVGLTKELMKLLSSQEIEGTYRGNALVILTNPNDDTYRLSLFTTSYDKNQGHKKILSNPRRQSFLLGQKRVHTPIEQLEKKGTIVSFEDLKKRFSIEVVNKEFYKNISDFFYALTGGTFIKGKQTYTVEPVMFYPGVTNDKKKDELRRKEFGVRLFGRIMFCWFLKQKILENGNGLIPSTILSSNAIQDGRYYNTILEPLFFETLNKPQEERSNDYRIKDWLAIPYLNGGLFHPQDEDYFDKSPNEVYIPDDWFKKFFEFLELYNFTIDENTSIDQEMSVDPEMLGRIFENLLAEINPETGESARKSTGSFYTPREIVEYMVDESIVQYLLTHTEVDENKIRALVSYDLDDDQDYPMIKIENEIIFNQILKLKIFDPACGSGAYPIGVLQKLLYIMQTVDPDGILWTSQKLTEISDPIQRDMMSKVYEKKDINYLRKLTIIRDIIYGCDIQSIAVETSKLRCFLTLIVDEKININQENFGIEPLPNLEFKFVCANTLIPLDINMKSAINDDVGFGKGGKKRQTQLFNNLSEQQIELDKLLVKRKEYFSSHHKRKQEIKKEIELIQSSIFTLISRGGLTGDMSSEHIMEVNKIINWKMFEQKSADFFDLYWMYGIEDGFDIVIGNPPYVQLQKLKGDPIQKIYKDSNYQVHDSNGDLYCLFYERGLELSRHETGILSYITSNKWMRAGYGEKLRSYFYKKNPLILIDLGPGVFDSATVDTNILIIQNINNNNKMYAITLKKDESENIYQAIQKRAIYLPCQQNGPWFIGTSEKLDLKTKIEKLGIILKECNIKMFSGLKTGLNEAFIIDESIKNNLINNNPENQTFIKPLLRGKDIHKYGYDISGLYIIFIPWHFPLHNDDSISGASVIAENKFSERYSKIYDHIKTFKQKLLNRNKEEVGIRYEWYALQRCASSYYNEFSNEKIIFTKASKEQSFAYDDKGNYLLNTSYILTGEHLKYILAILNSNFSKFVFGSFYEGGGIKGEITLDSIEKFPIPPYTNKPQVSKKIEELVEEILIKKRNQEFDIIPFQVQIEQLVYQLYDLTPEEIQIVEGNIS